MDGEVAVVVTDATDLLDHEIYGFGRFVRSTARRVVDENLVTPTIHGLGEVSQLGHVGVGGGLEEHGQTTLRVRELLRCVDLRKDSRASQTAGISPSTSPAARQARSLSQPPVVEVAPGHQQQPADPVERVTLATSMTRRGLLHAATDIVHRFGCETDRVEAIDNQR